MKRNLDKIAFVLTVIVAVLGLAFLAGLYSGAKKNLVYRAAQKVVENVALVFAERENLIPDGTPVHFLQPARQPGSGVTINQRADDGGLILISGFFDGNNELRLIQRDGTIKARWPVRYSELFPDPSFLDNPPETDHNIDTHGALILPDGSVVFNFDYGGMVKLGRCGQTIWTLNHATHHSVERSEKGGYWVPGRAYIRPAEFGKYWPLTYPNPAPFALEDLVLKVSADGQILARKPVLEFLFDNGMEPLLTANGRSFTTDGYFGVELTHLNKIAELPAALADSFPQFDAGDLLLSFRTHNLLLVVDPDNWKVKWHQTGPWRRQHDPEFNADGTISLFNNNTYELNLDPGGRTHADAPQVSNIMKVNPATGAVQVVYGAKPGEAMMSVIRGKQDPVPGGGYLVTEFEAGRVFQTDPEGKIVWEYVNRYDADQVLEVTEARLYPASYFSVGDWTCP